MRHPLSTPSTIPPIYSILLVQFTCLTVLFHNLCPRPLSSSSWSGALYFTLHVLDSPFPQPLSRSALVFLLVWGPLLHTPSISENPYPRTTQTKISKQVTQTHCMVGFACNFCHRPQLSKDTRFHRCTSRSLQ